MGLKARQDKRSDLEFQRGRLFEEILSVRSHTWIPVLCRTMEEGSKCDEAKQSTLDFKCRKILNAAHKPCDESPSRTDTQRLDAVPKLEAGIAAATPEKASERLAVKSRQEAVELPDRYRAIVELFRQMTCSLRLLNLCKKSPTFHNIFPQVEILAKRKFSYKHLAQIKYILPEAVQIDKILLHDEESQCMKPDLRITLVFDVGKDHTQTSKFTALCQLFLSRVVDVFSSHSEDYDIPEAALPQPFSQENGSASPETILQEASIGPASSSVDIGLLEDSSLMTSQIEQNSSENTAAQRVNSSPISLTVTDCQPGCSLACDSPITNRNLEAAKLMVETPAQLAPKRATLETEDSLTAISNNVLGLEKPVKRSLDFTYEKANEYVLENTMGKTVHLMTMQHDILQTSRSKEYLAEGNVKSNEEDEDGGNNCTLPGPDSDKSISEMRCKMSSSLCGCVTVIHHIFQSVNYFPVTKQELVFKILINSLALVEREMAEEHLAQLELLLPNWISKTISPSGDLMYSIKKLSDISTVLADVKAME